MKRYTCIASDNSKKISEIASNDIFRPGGHKSLTIHKSLTYVHPTYTLIEAGYSILSLFCTTLDGTTRNQRRGSETDHLLV